MARRLAILQSNYIPWKGYFDLIGAVDHFILYDTAQFTKNDWRNRNKIKTPRGPAWLTIPVHHHFGQSIEDTRISDRLWAKRHWDSLAQNYAGAAHYREFSPVIRKIYADAAEEERLSVVNHRFLTEVNAILGIRTPITWSREWRLVDGQTERLVDLCRQLEADEYVSGPAAKGYLEEGLFAAAGIVVTYVDYSGYPEYRQLHPPFEHGVSIVDMIFNEGPDARSFMKNSAPTSAVEQRSGDS